MANHISHASLPYPIKNARYTVLVPFLDSTGAPTDPTTPDTEVTQDVATFADATEEVTTITGSNGMGYVTFTGAETNNSAVGIAFKVASGPKPTLATLYPKNLAIVGSGTLSAGSAGGGTLGTLLAYDVTGCFLRTTGGTGGGGTGGANNQARRIITYNTGTGAFTVSPNWETTPDATTTYDVLLPEGVTLGMLKALNPTTAGDTLTLTSNRVDIGKWLGSAVTLDTNNVPNVSAKFWAGGLIPTPTVPGVPNVNTKTINDVATTAISSISAFLGSTGAAVNGTNINTLSSHDPGATLGTGTSTLTQAQVTGGSYALSTDANGRIRIVDGTAAGELDTTSGKVDINDKTGFSLSQAFPTNFSLLAIDASGRIDLGKVKGTASAGQAGYMALDWAAIANASTATNTFDNTSIAQVTLTLACSDASLSETTKHAIRPSILNAAITTVNSQLSFDLTTGPTTDSAIPPGSLVVFFASTDSNHTNPAWGIAGSYSATNKRLILSAAATGHTITTADSVKIYPMDQRLGTPAGASLAADVAALPASVWAAGTRTLSSGANIALAKGTGVTGFNDIAATDVWAAGTRTLSGLGFTLTASDLASDIITAAKVAADVWTEGRTAINGGDWALSTNSLGMIRIADGTATGEIDTSSGAIATVLSLTNDPTGVTTLLSRVSATRSGYLDNLSAGAVATAAALAALNNLSAAQVNAEVVDALAVDTYPLPGQITPSATPTLAAAIMQCFQSETNPKDQDATTQRIYNRAGSVVHQKRTASDDTTTGALGALVAGP